MRGSAPASMASSSSRQHGHNKDNDAHMGPIPLDKGGTLTAADRDDIYSQTWVSASVRYRPQWGQRCLSLAGPPDQLSRAKSMALQRIEAHGEEGGRVDPNHVAMELAEVKRNYEMLKTTQESQALYVHKLESDLHAVYTMAASAQSAAQHAMAETGYLKAQLIKRRKHEDKEHRAEAAARSSDSHHVEKNKKKEKSTKEKETLKRYEFKRDGAKCVGTFQKNAKTEKECESSESSESSESKKDDFEPKVPTELLAPKIEPEEEAEKTDDNLTQASPTATSPASSEAPTVLVGGDGLPMKLLQVKEEPGIEEGEPEEREKKDEPEKREETEKKDAPKKNETQQMDETEKTGQ